MARKANYIKVIGIGIFILILFKIDIQGLVRIWKDINIGFLAGALLSLFSLCIIRALKWKYIMGFFSIPVSIRQSIEIFWVGLFLGMITPAKVGEIIKIYFLDNIEQIKMRALLSVFVDRVSDLLALGVWGIVSSVVIFNIEISTGPVIVIFILAMSLLAVSVKFKLICFIKNLT